MPNLLDAPIPGQSLTRPPKSSPIEQPPKFTRRDEVQDYFFDLLTSEKGSEQIVMLLEAGAPVEGLARTFLYTGAIKGLYTVDIMLLTAKDVYYLIAAIAKVAGVENIKMKNPDVQREKFLDSIIPALERAKRTPEETPVEEKIGGLFDGLKE